MEQSDLLFTPICRPYRACAFSGFGLKKAFQQSLQESSLRAAFRGNRWKRQTSYSSRAFFSFFVRSASASVGSRTVQVGQSHRLLRRIFEHFTEWSCDANGSSTSRLPNIQFSTADSLMLSFVLQFPLTHILHVQPAWETFSDFTESMSKCYVTEVRNQCVMSCLWRPTCVHNHGTFMRWVTYGRIRIHSQLYSASYADIEPKAKKAYRFFSSICFYPSGCKNAFCSVGRGGEGQFALKRTLNVYKKREVWKGQPHFLKYILSRGKECKRLFFTSSVHRVNADTAERPPPPTPTRWFSDEV